jgi:hypothetical protein
VKYRLAIFLHLTLLAALGLAWIVCCLMFMFRPIFYFELASPSYNLVAAFLLPVGVICLSAAYLALSAKWKVIDKIKSFKRADLKKSRAARSVRIP